MRKILTITIIAFIALIAMSTNIKAADVSKESELENALKGTDETVILTNDIIVDSEIEITNLTTKTLNLNGKTLTLNKSLVIAGGNLTIKGNGKVVTEVADTLINVKEGSTLVLENGEFNSSKYGGSAIKLVGSAANTSLKTNLTIQKEATIKANYGLTIVKNAGYGININIYGTIQGITGNNGWNYGSMAIAVNGTGQQISQNASKINIYEGAKISADEGSSGDINDDDAPALYAAGYAHWNIFGGSIKGSEAISIKSGNFNIKGGTFTATGKYVDPAIAEGSGSEATGSAISITKNSGYAGNVKLSISNANVSSVNGYAISEQTTKGTGTVIDTISISGGDFSGEKGAISIANANEIGEFITGGKFNSDVKAYINSDTLTSVQDKETGEFYVGTLMPIKVEESINGKVEVSLLEAVKGQTVKVIVKPNEGYKLAVLQIFDLHGNEIKVVDGKFIMVDEEVTVKAEFEKIIVENEEEIEGNEKDETPKTGGINFSPYIWIAIITMLTTTAIKSKKTTERSKR